MTERYMDTMNGKEFDDYEDCCADLIDFVQDRLPAIGRAVDGLIAAANDPGIGYAWDYILRCVAKVNCELPAYSSFVEDIADFYIDFETEED